MKTKIILISLIFLFYFFYFWWYSYFYFPKSKNPNVFYLLSDKKEKLNFFDVEILKNQSENGTVFLFLPKNSNLNLQPVILVFHGFGWCKENQVLPQKEISYLAKKGYIVILPCYQEGFSSLFFRKNLLSRAEKLSLEGISKLKEIAPENDFSKFSILGVSLGGAVATNFFSFSLPKPKVLILIAPAPGFPLIPSKLYGIPFARAKELPENIILIGILAEKDRISSFNQVKKFFLEAKSKEKYLFLIPSDNYGTPPLVSNHSIIFGDLGPINYFGTYQIIEKGLNCAFESKDCEFLRGEKTFSLGKWSDGTEARKVIKIDLK